MRGFFAIDAMSTDAHRTEQEPEAFSVGPARSMRDVSYALELVKAEGWTPGESDAELLYTFGPEGFLMIKLNGCVVGCIMLLKYNSNHALVWNFVVEKCHRGNGFGSRAFAFALDHLSVSNVKNISLDASDGMAPYYLQRGFSVGWKINRYKFDVDFLAHKLSEIVNPSCIAIITPLDQVDFQTLAEYDESIFGEPRHKWLEVWISQPKALGNAALDEHGKIIGYVTVQAAIADNTRRVKEFRARPMLADSVDIALCLLHSVVKSILQCPASSGPSAPYKALILGDLALDVNKKAALIPQQLGGQLKYTNMKMYTNGSKQAMEKVFFDFS